MKNQKLLLVAISLLSLFTQFVYGQLDSLFKSNPSSEGAAYEEYLDYKYYLSKSEKYSETAALFGALTIGSASFIVFNKPDKGLAGLDELALNTVLIGVGTLSFFVSLNGIVKSSRSGSKAKQHLDKAIDIYNQEDKSTSVEESLGLSITSNSVGLVYSF